MCGENLSLDSAPESKNGSSPRVRGKPRASHGIKRRPGLIPACAGKTPHPARRSASIRAHPRVCGENLAILVSVLIASGSSPRVRGKPYGRRPTYPGPGLIPACAGKTPRLALTPHLHGAHPRVCGENRHPLDADARFPGSSPRVRGKLAASGSCAIEAGLIPACAGKTSQVFLTHSRPWAHPRVCGENVRRRPAIDRVQGSSPRVRGKL